MDRRDFLKKAGQTVALASVAGQAGLIDAGCQSGGSDKTSVARPNFQVADDPKFPKVVLVRNEDHAKAVSSALDAMGSIGRFVGKGEKVLLKPNCAFARAPEQAVNTNPIVVGEMVRQCLAAGASDVMVTDYGAYDIPKVFARSGIADAVAQNGGRVLYPVDEDFIEAEFGGIFIDRQPILKWIFEIDRLINMPIAKHHALTFGTASMKNFFGAIGGDRDRLHDQIDQAIVDLAAYFRPTLTVVDATRVLMRGGPAGGSSDYVKICNSVICATDQVAADARACEFVGHTAGDIRHVVLAAQQGLGEIDYHKAGYKEIV